MFFPSTKHLPKELTSYDLLKSLAVITMGIDHVGLYLFSEQHEFRIIGRMSMPIWLFLVGYANTRDFSPAFLIGGVVLVMMNIISGQGLFVLNILFTIILVRFLIDRIMYCFFKNTESMFFITGAIILLIIVTDIFFDYGTHAFLFAMFGYLVRHKDRLVLSNNFILIFMGLITIIHCLYQQFAFDFSAYESLWASSGVLLVCLMMRRFKSLVYKGSNKVPGFVSGAMKVMGRYSLEFYVIHILLLQSIGFYLFFDEFSWFELRWF